jgi:hypothetical protein
MENIWNLLQIIGELRSVIMVQYHDDFGIKQKVNKIVILFPLFWSFLLIPLGLWSAQYVAAPVTVITVQNTAKIFIMNIVDVCEVSR